MSEATRARDVRAAPARARSPVWPCSSWLASSRSLVAPRSRDSRAVQGIDDRWQDWMVDVRIAGADPGRSTS